ncbi:MAG: CHAT domain-containing protein [Flammeovirgaceae bacterium]
MLARIAFITVSLLWCYAQSFAQTTTLQQAQAYGKKGDQYYSKSLYNSSSFYYQQAADAFEQLAKKENDLKIWDQHFQYLYFKAWNFSQLGKHQDAVDFILPQLERAQGILGNQHRQIANFYNGLGNAYQYVDQHKKSISCYNQAIAIKKHLYGENSVQVALTQSNVGVVYNDLGSYDSAIAVFEAALEIYFASGKVDRLASQIGNAYNNIGYSFRIGKNNNRVALEYFRKSLPYRLKAFGQDGVMVAQTYRNIGVSSMHIGAYDTAMVYYQKAFNIKRKKLGDQHPTTAASYNDLGLLHMELGNTDSALHYYKINTATMIATVGATHSAVATGYNNMASVFEATKNYDSAVFYYHKALEIKEKVFDQHNPVVINAHLNLGKLYYHNANYDAALNYLEKAICANAIQSKDCLQSADPSELVGSIHLMKLLDGLAFKAHALYEKNPANLLSALQLKELCDHLIDQIKKGRIQENSLIDVHRKVEFVYQGAVQMALAAYEQFKDEQYLEKAFYFSEKNKANALLNNVSITEQKMALGIPEALFQQEQEFKNQLAYYQQKLTTSKSDPEQHHQYRDQLFEATRAYEKFINELEKNYPNYYDLKYSNKVTSLAHLQDLLPEGHILLSYAFASKHSAVFVIQKESVNVVPITSLTEVQTALDNYYNELQNENRLQDFAKASGKVYELLIKSIATQLQGKKKLIITSPLLLSIPFESLIQEAPNAKIAENDAFDQLNYLVNDFEISYHYSATLWLKTFNQHTNDHLALLGFAPYSEGESGMFTTRGQSFQSLPESGNELKEIYQLFERKKHETTVYLAQSASKVNFLEQVANYGIIHIASHSNADMHEDKLAKIHFAECVDLEKHTTSCLFANAIYNLNLKADLVVLSSCESGAGKLVKGEGVLSLARAFLNAGAKNVVSSLWEADDLYTKKLMLDFYTHKLESATTYSAALRAAKLSMIQSDTYLHPKYWSDFILIGN